MILSILKNGGVVLNVSAVDTNDVSRSGTQMLCEIRELIAPSVHRQGRFIHHCYLRATISIKCSHGPFGDYV